MRIRSVNQLLMNYICTDYRSQRGQNKREWLLLCVFYGMHKECCTKTMEHIYLKYLKIKYLQKPSCKQCKILLYLHQDLHKLMQTMQIKCKENGK